MADAILPKERKEPLLHESGNAEIRETIIISSPLIRRY